MHQLRDGRYDSQKACSSRAKCCAAVHNRPVTRDSNGVAIKGETADFEEIKKMILERDYNDMHRAHSPLKRAADAVSLDSTGMGIDAVLQAILDIVAERVKEK